MATEDQLLYMPSGSLSYHTDLEALEYQGDGVVLVCPVDVSTWDLVHGHVETDSWVVNGNIFRPVTNYFGSDDFPTGMYDSDIRCSGGLWTCTIYGPGATTRGIFTHPVEGTSMPLTGWTTVFTDSLNGGATPVLYFTLT